MKCLGFVWLISLVKSSFRIFGHLQFTRKWPKSGLQERPIAFVSKAFNTAEQKWSTIQQVFAIFHCIRKRDHYLMGRKFPYTMEYCKTLFDSFFSVVLNVFETKAVPNKI